MKYLNLIGKTLRFRVAVASVEDLASAISPGYWDLSVILMDPCPLTKLSFDYEYPVIEVSINDPLAPYTSFLPEVTLDPYQGIDCGPLAFNFNIINSTKLDSIIELT